MASPSSAAKISVNSHLLDLDSKSAVLKFTVKSSIYKPMQVRSFRGCKTCGS